MNIKTKQGNKSRFNLDWLEMCYKTSPENLSKIEQRVGQGGIGFRLVKVPSRRRTVYYRHEFYIEIERMENPQDAGKWVEFATLCYGMKLSDEIEQPYVWIRIHNPIFYTTPDNGRKDILRVVGIADELGLAFNNFTRIDIAYDTTQNAPRGILRAIRCEFLTPIVRGKARMNPDEVIDEVCVEARGNQKRLKRFSIRIALDGKKYFSKTEETEEKEETEELTDDQLWRKKKILQLSVYDKGREIRMRGNRKRYICDSMGIKGQFFRCETRIGRLSIYAFLFKYCREWMNDLESLLIALTEQAFLAEFFTVEMNRLIRFRHKRNRTVYTLLDVLNSSPKAFAREPSKKIEKYPLLGLDSIPALDVD